MDIKSFSCFWLFLVLFTVNFRARKVACQGGTQAPGQKGNSSGVTQAPGQKGNSSGVTQAPGQQGVTQAPGTQAPGQQKITQAPGQQGVTQAPGTTTQVPIQCFKGNCTVKGNDEYCLKDIKAKCTAGSTGSCMKEVKKNSTHTFVTVYCLNTACSSKPTTTTAKPSTPAPATTSSICCEKHLCNQYQTKSAAFGLTTNIVYVIGVLILIVCM